MEFDELLQQKQLLRISNWERKIKGRIRIQFHSALKQRFSKFGLWNLTEGSWGQNYFYNNTKKLFAIFTFLSLV